MNHQPIALRASYVFPVGDEPLRGGVVTILGERIVAVGENLSGKPPREFPGCAIVPGLVNAHTHLEFSDLASPLGAQGIEFSKWIECVLEHRVASAEASKRVNIQRGLAESARFGVTSIGEISTGGWDVEDTANAEVVVFQELIGFSLERYQKALADATVNLRRAANMRYGLSPHAPYTVNDTQLAEITELAQRTSAPLAMHLAESPGEVELLSSGQGPLRELLQRRGVWDDALLPQENRLAQILGRILAAEGAVVHGNFLPIKLIHAAGKTIGTPNVIYCPRTHAYFGHRSYPLMDYLVAGWNVALGTDSRASSPDLDLLAEMQMVKRLHPDISAETILCMGTRNGAIVLGQSDRAGELRTSAFANLAIVQLAEGTTQDGAEGILADGSRVIETIWRGQTIYSA
jgi:cytosine/adenosine deaminase-related metal-dependent hydrolase